MVYIEYMARQWKKLNPGEAPVATFKLDGEKAVCNLKPLDLDAKENCVVCNCNKVSYFDILEALQTHNNLENLLDVFEDVKNTTHCSTGCGGCYEKVIAIISEALSTGKK